MGYESKIIIVERHEHEKLDGTLLPYGDDIACFDLSKMGYEQVNGKAFPAVFTNEIDFDLYCVDPEKPTRVDMYGDICKWADVEDVIDWLEASNVAKTYRRAKLFLDFVRCLRSHLDDFGQLCVVHFGY